MNKSGKGHIRNPRTARVLLFIPTLLLAQDLSWDGQGAALGPAWEMGQVATCGAEPFLHVGSGKSSCIRAGIPHPSSADVSRRGSRKLRHKCLQSCRNCLQSRHLHPCLVLIGLYVFWGCFLNPCPGPAFNGCICSACRGKGHLRLGFRAEPK